MTLLFPLTGGPGFIGWQVVQEFRDVALHRFARPVSATDLGDFLRLILLPGCRIMPTAQLHE